jgi:replicative DNA helicase
MVEKAINLGAGRTSKELVTAKQIIEEAGGMDAFLDPSRHKGYATPFRKWDNLTGGLNPCEMIIVAARPGKGKTALALCFAAHVLFRHHRPVVFFSLEMSREILLQRMIAAESGVDLKKIKLANLDFEERASIRAVVNDLTDAPIFIDDTKEISLSGIRSRLRRMERQYGTLGLVVVDYIQLMHMASREENRNQEVAKISRHMKLMAMELKCPFLVLSGLSRAIETRRGSGKPQLSDLRDSGALEADADIVAFIHQQALSGEKRKEKRKEDEGVELILRKVRNGESGTVPLVFLKHSTSFKPRADAWAENQEGQHNASGDNSWETD